MVDSEHSKRFRMLVCLDGSDEGYRGIRYAAKLCSGTDSDIIVMYLRSTDSEIPEQIGDLASDANLFDWGEKIPGVKYLAKARQILTDTGILKDTEHATSVHIPLKGDAIGNNSVTYTDASAGEDGGFVSFHHNIAGNVADGILKEIEDNDIDVVVLGASDRWRKSTTKSFWDPAIAEKVAKNAPCSVLVARDLEIGHGHLICTDGSQKALDMVRKDAELAHRCQCSVSLASIAMDEAGRQEAERHVDEARTMLEEIGIDVLGTTVSVGEPDHEIIELGPDYSLIVLSASSATGLKQFFVGSTAYKVMKEAYNSVMLVR